MAHTLNLVGSTCRQTIPIATTTRRCRPLAATTLVLAIAACGAPASAIEPESRNFAYRELEGTVEEFGFFHQWRYYYWRNDFTILLRDDAGKLHRVISREPTPWTNLRLGTTFPHLSVNWAGRPRVQVIGVAGIDRTPLEFYDFDLRGDTTTAFIVRVQQPDGAWQDYYVNNWFHRWGSEADRKVPPHYAKDDPHYTVYGYLSDHVVPFDAESARRIQELTTDYGGIIYHARVVKTDNDLGVTRRSLRRSFTI